MRVVLVALVLMLTIPFANAQTQVDARAEVAAALYTASATQAAAERAADAQLRAQAAEIERLRTEGAGARAELIAAQERYVADLAQRDHAYAQEIAVFRAAVRDIASTSEGAAALARFNAGDEIGALGALDWIVDARERARQVRASIETATERRRVAALALEARARGRLDTAAVLARYEEVTRLDPGVHWDWIELTRLFVDSGRLMDAQQSARRALDLASNNLETSAALIDLADVLSADGDLVAAKPLYEQSLAIVQAAYNEAPGSDTRRDLSISLSRLGDTSLGLGDAHAAIQRYNEAMLLDQQTHRGTSSLQSARDICVDYIALSDAIVVLGDFDSANTYLEAAISLCDRLAQDFGSGEDQLQAGYARWRRANIRAAQGDLDFARSEFQRLSQFAEEVLRADPTNDRLALQVRLLELGFADLDLLAGDFDRARARLESFIASLSQYRDQTGFQRTVDSYVWLALVRLSLLPNSQLAWTELESRSAAVITLADLSALDWLFIHLASQRARAAQ